MKKNPQAKLRNNIAILMGGSGGIGVSVAEVFAREGARVVIVSKNNKRVQQAVQRVMRNTGVEPLGLSADVSRPAELRRVAARVYKKFRRIDTLVNVAGVQAPIGPFASNDLVEWEYNVRVNLLGTVYACKAVLPFMAKRKSGSIINFSGGGATSSRPNFSAYAVAKTGVVKLTQILGDELAPLGIRVNAVAPGAVNTGMLSEVLAAGNRAGKKELAQAKERRRNGGTSPELVAQLAVFLASSGARGLTGRLISAPWDGWKTWNQKKIKEIMARNLFVLERKLA